jgi:hypothetical protein
MILYRGARMATLSRIPNPDSRRVTILSERTGILLIAIPR